MHRLNINFEPVKTDLHFIHEMEMKIVIESILNELKETVLIGAKRSMVYMSVSTLEGILSYLLRLVENKTKKAIQELGILHKSKPKKIEKLDLADMIAIAAKLNIIKNQHLDIFQLFRLLRNYMHPSAELKNNYRIDLGTAQMSVGFLNHMIDELNKIRFINEDLWDVISGEPIYDKDKNYLSLVFSGLVSTNSFITGSNINKSVEFDLSLKERGVFNIVYDFIDHGNFSMFRLDRRSFMDTKSGFLKCVNKHWEFKNEYDKIHICLNDSNKVRVNLINSNQFEAVVNGKSYSINNSTSTKKIGFFNEVESCTLENIVFT